MSSEIEKILSLGKFNRNRVGKYSIDIKIIMHYQNDGQIKGYVGNFIVRQAGAELGQAQLKLGLVFTSVYLYQIDDQEIFLASLTYN